MSAMLQLLRRNVKRFRGGLAFKAHRLVYHSTLGWRVIKKNKLSDLVGEDADEKGPFRSHQIAPFRAKLGREQPKGCAYSSSLLLTSLELSDTKVYEP